MALLAAALETRLQVLAEQCERNEISKHPSLRVDKIG
jgi:hypothetical protein